MPTGRVKMATNALRKCNRNRKQTRATTIISSVSFFPSTSIGMLNERGAVIDRHDLHTVGKSGLERLEFRFHALDGVQGVLAQAHDDDAARDLTLAVQLVRPRRNSGPSPTSAMSLSRIGVPAALTPTGTFSDQQTSGCTRATDHELGLGHLHQPAADVAVAALDRLHHPGQRYVVTPELDRVDRDLVLLDVPADAGDLGHPFHAGELVSQIPVLDAAQFLQGVAIGPQGVFVDPADAGGVRPQFSPGLGGSEPWIPERYSRTRLRAQ